jgi:Flp pilus assembly protein TadG
VVGFGRVERGRALVDQAAQAAARAASLTSTPAAADEAASQGVQQTLRGGGLSCANLAVNLDTSAFYAGGQVTAHVACHADLSDVAVAGLPGTVTLTASATAILETHRQLGMP